jgi:hypothetical protein
MGAPQTLPANFSGWDKPPDTLPKDFSSWDAPKSSPAATKTDGVPGFWDTLAREGKALTGTIAGMPAAVYHAFSEPPTKEEAAELSDHPHPVPDRVALGVQRLTTAPVEVAAKFYSDAAKGKYGDASQVESAMLNEAPEAMGAAGGSVVAGKLMAEAPGAVKAVPAVVKGALPAAADAVGSVMDHPVTQALAKTVDVASFNRLSKLWDAWKNVPEEIRARSAQPENPALTTPSRTLPGMNSPEVIRPPAATAQPIPPRTGLQLTGEVAPQAETAATPEPTATAPNGNTIPRTLSGDSALRQVLTGQDNANLLKIAKSRGINVTRESQLKPGTADNLLINKIVNDFSPDELSEIGAQYLENSRFRHSFGNIGPEAWKTMSLQTYFPDMKIPATTLARAAKAVAASATPSADDLTGILEKSLAQARARQ